jgi:polyisoprenoid-binding protein YceI
MKRWMLALVAIPALTAAAVIAPKQYVRDQAHSQLNFVAESRMLDAHGTFDKWDADISLDPANWGASSVVITIDTRTINTRIERRDAHLKSPDFFAADSFPTATFKSTIVKGETVINRKDYGINFDSNMNPISDEVKIQFDVAFTEKK